MSSPKMTRILGFFPAVAVVACAKTAIGKTKILTSRVSRIRIGFSFIGFVCYLLFVAEGLVKNGFPIVLHADDSPAFRDGDLSGFVRAALRSRARGLDARKL